MQNYKHVGRVAERKNPQKKEVDGRKHRKFWSSDEDTLLLENFGKLSYL